MEFDRPELAAFHALGTAQGWNSSEWTCENEVRFGIETSPTDEVTLEMQFDLDHLWLHLGLYPEASLAGATPPQMAAIIAQWLRDTAAKLEVAAAGTPIPAAFYSHCAAVEADRRLGTAATRADVAQVLGEMGRVG